MSNIEEWVKPIVLPVFYFQRCYWSSYYDKKEYNEFLFFRSNIEVESVIAIIALD